MDEQWISRKSRDGKVIRLDEPPSVTDVDEWMLSLGCQKATVGETVQGRDITLYWMDRSIQYPSNDVNYDNNVLFLSLVHGNEPQGLISLLMGALRLASYPSDVNNRKTSSKMQRVYFLPIVNVDAYELNMRKGTDPGCHRTNLRITCETNIASMNTYSNTAMDFVESCDAGNNLGIQGVDLNRNFPTDWGMGLRDGGNYQCMHNYGGPHPFSEPETQAIATVVETFNITHAISLHSMHDRTRPSLIIHPYTSLRSFSTMDETDARRFREWSWAMRKRSTVEYLVGTAQETINYDAGGTTIDWMYSEKQIVAFVLEVAPPCDNRWCRGDGVYLSSMAHAKTLEYFASLVVDEVGVRGILPENSGVGVGAIRTENKTAVLETIVIEEFYDETTLLRVLLFSLFFLGMIYSLWKRPHKCRLFLYRFVVSIFLKRKEDVSSEEKGEMLSLNHKVLVV